MSPFPLLTDLVSVCVQKKYLGTVSSSAIVIINNLTSSKLLATFYATYASQGFRIATNTFIRLAQGKMKIRCMPLRLPRFSLN